MLFKFEPPNHLVALSTFTFNHLVVNIKSCHSYRRTNRLRAFVRIILLVFYLFSVNRISIICRRILRRVLRPTGDGFRVTICSYHTHPKTRRQWNQTHWPSNCRHRPARRPPPCHLRMWTWLRLWTKWCWTPRASCCPLHNCCWWPPCRMAAVRSRYHRRRPAPPTTWPPRRTPRTCPPQGKRLPQPRSYRLRCCNLLRTCADRKWRNSYFYKDRR